MWSFEGNVIPHPHPRYCFKLTAESNDGLFLSRALGSPAYLLLVLLLHSEQLCLQLCLDFGKVISLLKQHLLHVSTTGVALFQDAFELADLYFGGDQLEEIKEDHFVWRMTLPHALGRQMSVFLKWTKTSSSMSKSILVRSCHMESTIE